MSASLTKEQAQSSESVKSSLPRLQLTSLAEEPPITMSLGYKCHGFLGDAPTQQPMLNGVRRISGSTGRLGRINLSLKRFSVDRVVVSRDVEVIGFTRGDTVFVCWASSSLSPVFRQSVEFNSFNEAGSAFIPLTIPELVEAIKFSGVMIGQNCMSVKTTPRTPTALEIFQKFADQYRLMWSGRHYGRFKKSIEPGSSDLFFVQDGFYLWAQQSISVKEEAVKQFDVDL